jgi:hypothetical protein
LATPADHTFLPNRFKLVGLDGQTASQMIQESQYDFSALIDSGFLQCGMNNVALPNFIVLKDALCAVDTIVIET